MTGLRSHAPHSNACGEIVSRSPTDKVVTVVGAGIVGICTALSLLECGAKVRLIDSNTPGQGASFGNAGIISPWAVVPQSMPGQWKQIPGWLLDPQGPIHLPLRSMPQFIPWGLQFLFAGRHARVLEVSEAMAVLNAPSITLYKRLLAGTGHEDLICDSHYIHAYRDATKVNTNGLAWELRRSQGAEINIIDSVELRRIEPALSHDYKAAIVIKGQARARDPGRICSALTYKIRALGGDVQKCSVKRLTPLEGSWRIDTDQGVLDAETVVIAAGAGSAALLKQLGLKVPLQAERGYHVMFENPGVTLNNSVMDVDLKFVSSTMMGGLRSAGTVEFTHADAPPTRKRAQMLIGQTKTMLPDLDIAKTTDWMGVRPSFPDTLPALGPVKGFPGLFAAFGHSHFGLMMAPKTGDLVADAVLERRNNIDLAPYRLDRF